MTNHLTEAQERERYRAWLRAPSTTDTQGFATWLAAKADATTSAASEVGLDQLIVKHGLMADAWPSQKALEAFANEAIALAARPVAQADTGAGVELPPEYEARAEYIAYVATRNKLANNVPPSTDTEALMFIEGAKFARAASAQATQPEKSSPLLDGFLAAAERDGVTHLKDPAPAVAEPAHVARPVAQPDAATLVEMQRQRDTLAKAIANAALKAGIYNGEVSLDGPTLLMLCEDLATSAQATPQTLKEQEEAFYDPRRFYEGGAQATQAVEPVAWRRRFLNPTGPWSYSGVFTHPNPELGPQETQALAVIAPTTAQEAEPRTIHCGNPTSPDAFKPRQATAQEAEPAPVNPYDAIDAKRWRDHVEALAIASKHPDWKPHATALLLQGNTLEAIRRCRSQLGIGLREAKDAVEALRNANRSATAQEGGEAKGVGE